MELPAKHFQSICTMLGYRKRKVRVTATLKVTLHGLNWQDGSKNTYHACDILTGDISTASHLGNPHPWFNENEGASVALLKNVAIIKTGIFMGKESVMEIFVHPDNMPRMLAHA